MSMDSSKELEGVCQMVGFLRGHSRQEILIQGSEI